MIISGCKIRGKEGLWDIVCENSRFSSIVPHGKMKLPKEVYNGAGLMMMPPFVEPHIHLDCVLTAGVPHFNMSGTLFEGISLWHDYKTTQTLDRQVIKENAKKALRLMAEHGVQFVRTHVDITETTFTGVQSMLELKEEMKEFIEIQTVAFPQNGIFSVKDGKKLMEQALDMGVEVIGGIPHYEFTREYGVESMKYICDLAMKHDAMIDVHCDEMDDEQSRFLEALATNAWEREIGSRVVASHTCAMGSYNDSYCTKLFRLLKESGIQFASCPTESIHLQGRADRFPKRRGITRIKELADAGMNVAMGQDSIADPWYPMGTGDLLRILDMGVHTCHMTGYEDLNHCLDFISHNGAENLCITDHYGIEEGKPASFILLDQENDYDALRFHSTVVLSVHNGRIISEKVPASVSVKF